jgi:hypothetical protein
VPEAQDDARREICLPGGLGGDDGVHEAKELSGVVVWLDVNVEHDMLVFRLARKRRRDQWLR